MVIKTYNKLIYIYKRNGLISANFMYNCLLVGFKATVILFQYFDQINILGLTKSGFG